jgi:type VI secretion system secreted protein Hcp
VVAERWFLKLAGITGESTHAAHKGEIDVESWSWGVSNTSSSSGGGGGGGGGAGKASFQDFHFVSRISKASPALFTSCASGSHIKEALLSGVRGAGKGTDYLKYKLRDVVVTSLMQSDNDADPPVEQFSLSFAKVEWSYTPQSQSGKLEPPVTAGWDLKANKKL